MERLPWLEPVEDEDDYQAPGEGRRWAVIGGVILVAGAMLVAAVVAIRHWHAGHADIGGVIRAPATPYKVKPQDAGGLAVDQSGVVAEQTGTGAEIDAPLALVAPEQPVIGPGSQPPASATAAVPPAPTQPKPAATAATAPVVPPPPATTASAGRADVAQSPSNGGTIQLGAFSSEEKARAAWKSLAKRFSYLAPMTPAIVAADSNGDKVWRLRASGGEPAARLCARLQVAGEACAVVG